MSKLDETIKRAIFLYDKLPEIMKYQILTFSEEMSQDRKVSSELNLWKKKYDTINFNNREISGKELRNLFLQACIFKNISALRISEKERFPALECYNEFGEPTISIHKLLTEGSSVKLFKGRFLHDRYSNGYGTEKDVIIKLFESRDGKNTTEYEINIYRNLGDPSPSLGVNCYLWNIPVLVMRPMEKLSKDDDEIEVGVQILRQLPALHRFTTHSDFKFDNLMKELGGANQFHEPPNPLKDKYPEHGGGEEKKMGNYNDINRTTSTRHHSSHHRSDPNNKNDSSPSRGLEKSGAISVSGPHYRIIDYGGCPRERLGIGFKRRTWTRKWTLQKRGTTMTTPKYDLLELGHTLSAIQHCRENKTRRYPHGPEKRVFKGYLKEYMDYVEKIDDLVTNHKDYGPHYDALIQILLGGRRQREGGQHHPNHHSVPVSFSSNNKGNEKEYNNGAKLLKPITIERSKTRTSKISKKKSSKSSRKHSSSKSSSSSSSSSSRGKGKGSKKKGHKKK
jgi:uncharacterized membrane protein YgcG